MRLARSFLCSIALGVLIYAGAIGALHAFAMLGELFGIFLGPLGGWLRSLAGLATLIDARFADAVAGDPIHATALAVIGLVPSIALAVLLRAVWRRRRAA